MQVQAAGAAAHSFLTEPMNLSTGRQPTSGEGAQRLPTKRTR